jgi:hypothetical protein
MVPSESENRIKQSQGNNITSKEHQKYDNMIKNMAKKRCKRRSLKKLSAAERKNNAKKWLSSPQRLPKGSLLSIYSKRYGILEKDAYIELMELGYYETLQIEYYEEEGIEWEYQVDGYSGDFKVVPKGTPPWELYLY